VDSIKRTYAGWFFEVTEMFFKKKVTTGDYCREKLMRLFSQERETTWDDLRIRCDDAHLNQADRRAYYDNLRAAMIELMMVAVAKNFHWKVRDDVGICVDGYLKGRGVPEIGSLYREYNRAFGTPSPDGVALMVQLFADKLTQSRMDEPTKAHFLHEFYAKLRAFYEEFKSIKLVSDVSEEPTIRLDDHAPEKEKDVSLRSYTDEKGTTYFNTTLVDTTKIIHTDRIEYSNGRKEFEVTVFPSGVRQVLRTEFPDGTVWFKSMTGPDMPPEIERIESHGGELKYHGNVMHPDGTIFRKMVEYTGGVTKLGVVEYPDGKELAEHVNVSCGCHYFHYRELNGEMKAEKCEYCEKHSAKQNPNAVLTATKPEPKPVVNEVRINELARELEVKGKAIIDLLPGFGVTEKKTHSSSITVEVAEKVRHQLASRQWEACVIKGQQKEAKEAGEVLEPTEAWKNEFMNRMFGKYPLYVHRNELLEATQKLTENSSETKSVALSLTSLGDTQFTGLKTEGDHPFEDVPRIGLLHASDAIICAFFSRSGAQQLMSMTIAPDGRIADATFCPYEIIKGKFVWGEPDKLVFGENTRNDFAWRRPNGNNRNEIVRR
jgi:hypothetical protein